MRHRPPRAFDVAELYRGPIAEKADAPAPGELALDEELRQAYFWVVNTAIISPHYDIEFNEEPPQEFRAGDSKGALTLPSGQSYSSFVLLPLLTFALRRKCLFIGGPGCSWECSPVTRCARSAAPCGMSARFRCGLVVGKFAPLDRGHELVIRRALECCEEVVVISYTKPEFSGCEPKRRAQWLGGTLPADAASRGDRRVAGGAACGLAGTARAAGQRRAGIRASAFCRAIVPARAGRRGRCGLHERGLWRRIRCGTHDLLPQNRSAIAARRACARGSCPQRGAGFRRGDSRRCAWRPPVGASRRNELPSRPERPQGKMPCSAGRMPTLPETPPTRTQLPLQPQAP